MRAVVFKDNELSLDKNFPKPELKENEALIKIKYAGICNTDMELIKGYMGFSGVLGHEFVGVVEDVNSPDKSLIGKRVVGEINCGCNNCEWCHKGLQRHCPNRQTLGIWKKDGCMSDYLNMPIDTLVEVPSNITNEEAVLVEPFAAAFEILEQLHIKPEDKVIILGDGKLGLSIAFALSRIPCFLTLVGKHDDKLKIAEKQNVNTIQLQDLKVEKTYDIVIDATGSVTVLKLLWLL
jgi:threonine dehydrogenase-like Zn-dependent dehydrogenase